VKAGAALLAHSARRARVLVLISAGLLAGFQILLILAAKSLQELDTFSGLTALVPDFLRQILGTSFITMMSFRGIACLGFFHVAIVAFLVGMVIVLGTEPAGEMEMGFFDLVLSHPLRRHWIVTRTIALLAACILVLLGAMVSGTKIGLYWLAAPDTARATFAVVPRLALNLGMLLLCWGSIALLLAAVAQRRSTAAATAGLLAMTCYMTDVISQVWKTLKPEARFSPFHYYNSLNLIGGAAQTGHDILVLACITAACFSLAYLLFRSRDL
jgi:ABC-type transport system involved in multi-copper enzyme maturation permease subunit